MKNFDVLDGCTSVVTVSSTPPRVVERVTATPIPSSRHLLQDEAQWTWQELRDYVITQIEHRHGPQVRNAAKEKAIFSSFLSRWGTNAVPIAKAAFTIYDGMWANAPISVFRFCKASDPFFGKVILDRLEH